MSHILDKICENKKIEVEQNKKKCSFSSLEKIIKDKKNRGFAELLIKSQKNNKNNIIAEIKKGSPSAGIIIQDYYPENIAINYEKSGIGAISILTDNSFFYGNLDHLSIVNKKSKLPILRKDFIIDPYQIAESKVYQADAILLIVSVLSDNQIKDFINLANKYGLDCLVEIHNAEELNRALNIGYPIIGINNRNLKDMTVNLDNTLELIKNIPNDFTVVSESGIKTREDIKRFNDSEIFNFLIGESILKSQDISSKIIQLRS